MKESKTFRFEHTLNMPALSKTNMSFSHQAVPGGERFYERLLQYCEEQNIPFEKHGNQIQIRMEEVHREGMLPSESTADALKEFLQAEGFSLGDNQAFSEFATQKEFLTLTNDDNASLARMVLANALRTPRQNAPLQLSDFLPSSSYKRFICILALIACLGYLAKGAARQFF
jgi:hypothetical protein